MIKNKFKDDYSESSSGKYNYVGQYYTLPMDDRTKKKTNYLNFVFVFLFFLFEILIGTVNPDSSRTLWIVLPYFFLFLPIAYMAIGAYAYAGARLKMETAEYRNSITRMRRSVVGILVVAGINIVLDIVFMILNRATIAWGREAIYMAGLVCIVIVGVAFGKFFDKYYARISID